MSQEKTGASPEPEDKQGTDGDGPTVAIALEYDPNSTDSAPRVLATGKGAVAEQILELAFAHGVKVRQDADLANILTAVDLDSEIPVEAFAAVAEILAYVYRANGQMIGEEPLSGASEEPLSGASAEAFAAAMADQAPGTPALPVHGGRPVTALPPEAPTPDPTITDQQARIHKDPDA